LYEAIRDYLETGQRVQLLNDRLAVSGELVCRRFKTPWDEGTLIPGPLISPQLEIIHDYIDQGAMHRITWIIIILIGMFLANYSQAYVSH
jgi:uncharacterized Rmd1/YagE family protein